MSLRLAAPCPSLVRWAGAIWTLLSLAVPAFAGPDPPRLLRANRAFESGGYWAFAHLADINKDGHLDVITSSVTNGMLLVLFNNGLGELTPSALPSQAYFYTCEVADFTGDGIVDLITSGNHSRAPWLVLQFYVGVGDGTFRPAGNHSVERTSFGTVPIDLDLDGRLDLVTSNGRGVVAYYGGDVDSMPLGITVIPSVTGTLLEAGDISGDGRPDLISFRQGFLFWLATGARTYSPQASVPRLDATINFALSDLNDDGRADLVAAFEPKGLRWWMQRPAGGIDATTATQSLNLSFTPGWIADGDWNRDGSRDLLVATSSRATSLLGDGRGGLREVATLESGGHHGSPAVGDVTCDGVPDLVMGGHYGIVVFEGHGDGTFGTGTPTHTAASNPTAHVLGDFDGDGTVDVAYRAEGAAYWAKGRADGTLEPGRLVISLTNTDTRLVAGDFNGDGIADLVAGNWQEGACMLGSRAGPTGRLEIIPHASPAGAGDLNGDGKDELITAGNRPGEPYIALHAFESDSLRYLGEVLVPYLSKIVVRDVDHDGKADVVCGNWSSIAIVHGREGPAFGPITRHASTRVEFQSMAAGDLNEDGHDDLVIATQQALWVFASGPDGFRSRRWWSNVHSSDLAIDDFDGDGHLDVAIAADGDAVSFWLGDGSGGLRSSVAYQSGEGLAVGDLDQDGDADIVTRSSLRDRINVFMNQTDVPRPPRIFGGTPPPVRAGTKLRFSGLGLRAASQASVGGGEASFRVLSDEVIEVVVPRGAPRIGPLVVMTPRGSVTGPDVITHAEAIDSDPVADTLDSVDTPVAEARLPMPLEVGWPYPNPARSSVRLAVRSSGDAVAVEVHSLSGNLVHRSEYLPSEHGVEAVWSLMDTGGRRVPPGLYWIRVSAGPRSMIRKVIVTGS